MYGYTFLYMYVYIINTPRYVHVGIKKNLTKADLQDDAGPSVVLHC